MFTLTIEDNNGQVANQFSFDHGSYVIGRLDDCDIVLPSTSVSRQHARVFVEDGRCFIEDMGSSNGVIVDGQRVLGRRDLGTASQIRVGDFYLYLEFKRSPQQLANQNVLSTLFIASGADHFKLVRINDAFAGEEFSLSESSNTIGRTDENFILLSDVSISRQHAQIDRIGDHYSVVDSGSSNGTLLNGKPVRSRQPLQAGDIVQFGNLRFVFLPGDARIDPREYSQPVKKRSSSLTLYVSLAVLLLAGIAVGGMTAFGIFSMGANDGSQPDAQHAAANDILQATIAELREATDKHILSRNWAGATATSDDLLALAPANPEFIELKSRIRLEKDAADLLERGEELSEQGRHAEAQTILLQIPPGTVAYDAAQSTLKHVNKTLAYNLKTEANRIFNDRSKKANPLEAHKKVIESLDLVSDDAEALTLLSKIEAQLTKRNIKFEPYASK